MWRSSKQNTISFISFLLFLTCVNGARPGCNFPESSSSQSFFFDVRADTPTGSIITDSVVEPSDAQLKVTDVRSNNLKGSFLSRFEIEKRQDGQFRLITTGDLNLPSYPSTITETIFYLTVECNQKVYPLISVRVRNYNSHSPKFLNEPYEVVVVQETQVGSLIPTPVLAIDEDPAREYTITYSILNDQHNREFQLEKDPKPLQDIDSLPEPYNLRPYSRQQLPHPVNLRVLSSLRRKTYYLNVNATDNQDPPRQSTALLKVVVGHLSEIMPHFTQKEYYANFTRNFEPGTELVLNQPLMAAFPAARNKTASSVRYELLDSKYADLFELHPTTGRLFMRQKPFSDPTETIELDVKAFIESSPDNIVKTKILLHDVSEVRLTYFAQCHYDVHLAENSLPNTKVAQFVIDGIDLLNGTEYFSVDKEGIVTVSKDAVIDYEDTDRIIVTARLRSSSALHPKSLELCQIATIDVHIDDVNDHSPKFEKPIYTFYTGEEYPYNNTEIGTVRATDDDTGIFGKVHYRILDSGAPFVLFEADGEATIYYVTPMEDYFPDKAYTITVEAFDAKEYPRTARINVRILLQPAPAATQSPSSLEDSTTISTTLSADTAATDSKPQKLDKPKKQFRTLGVTSEDKHRVSVEEEEEEPKEFGGGPETFRDVEKERSEGIVGQEEDLTTTTTTLASNPTTTPFIQRQFEQQNYNFTLNGHLDHGQYIGTIRLVQPDDEEPDEEFSAGIEYTVEEGIKGFVKIDPDGTLRLDSKLIEDSYEQIRFAAQARKNGRIVASTVVSVYINESAPVYAQNPRFEQALYRFELEENQPAQSFAQVEAHHRAVELGQDHLWYTLNRDRDAAPFRIDPETGQLRGLEPLDAETRKFYSLTVNSCLESNTKKCAHAEVIVVIKDLNDNEPQFSQQSYNLKLPPDLSAGTEIVQVHATDKDSGRNGEVIYELMPSNAEEHFSVDTQTGQVKLIKSFNSETPTQLTLRIAGKDMGEPPLMGLADIHIELTNDAKFTNENAPEFDDFRYEFSRSLPVPEGSLVATVRATDPDEGENGKLWYQFAEDTAVTRKFKIDKETGEIRTLSELTGEASGQLIQLLVEVHDSSPTFSRKSDTVVLLHLLGEKEERLEFLPLPKIVYISSSKPLGSTIFKVGLKKNIKDVHYTVEQDQRSEYFAMIDDLLVVQSKLRPGTYRIAIKAQTIPPTIGKDPPKQMSVESHSLKMVVMTNRDLYPVFDKLSYELKIASNANFPVKLPAFNATVNDGRVGYSLYNLNELRGVKIDSITGELTIFEEFVQQVAEDLPRGMVFIVVRATNLNHPGFFSDIGVRLGLLNSGHDLIFTSRLYRLITRENTSPGTVINTVKIGVLEPDLFPRVQYSLEPNDLFDIIGENGSVIVRKPINLEELPPEWKGIVEITVTAQHIGQTAHAQIQIKVEDVNEFTPKFDNSSYDFPVDIQQIEGTWIGQVHATDEDFNDRSGLAYRAVLGNAVGLVNITRDGKLVLNRGVKLYPGQNYSMVVQATDSGNKFGEAAIHFEVTDSSQQHKTIEMPTEKWTPESEDEKKLLPSMSSGNWNFQIMSGNEMDRIKVERINKTTAQLGLKTERLRSGNLNKAEDLIVLEISNLDDPFDRLHTNISVDLNKVLTRMLDDNQTEILVDLSKIHSQSTPLHKIPVPGTSQDIRFELTENPLDMFRVDSKTGDLYAEWPLEQIIPGGHEITVTIHLDKQQIRRAYGIKIIGEFRPEQEATTPDTDNQTPTIADLNDDESTTISTQITIGSGEELEPFGFEEKEYKFEVYNPQKGAVVEDLKIRGAQGPIQWQIEPKPYRQWFDMNQTTGSLVIRDVPFELKGRQRAEFIVQALDLENLNNRAEVNVSVDLILPDSSDNGDVEVETATHGLKVETTTETSEKPTSPLPSSQPFTEETPIFYATPDLAVTEVVVTTTSVKPDLLTNLPTSSSVTRGPDEKDSTFHFKHKEYTAMLPEREYGNRGTVVNLRPALLKEGLEDAIFGIETDDPNLPFFVRNQTGDLIAFNNIDREQVNEFHFNVTAYKASNPDEQTRAQVKITILDVNDNYPQFNNPTHLVALNLDSVPGQVLAVFKTTDADAGSNGRVAYRLTENPNALFDINSRGELILSTKLPPSFHDDLLNVTVEAVDGGRPGLRASHDIQIQLFPDSSAGQPFFHSSEYTATVGRDADVGTYVTQVTAGVGPFNYLILDDNAELFTIDNRGLVQLVHKPFPQDKNHYHALTVIAESSDGKTANTTINVFVDGEPLVVSSKPVSSTPSSKQSCKFTAKTYNAEIRENTQGRTKLTTVQSTCPVANVHFVIHQATKEFEIDEKTGDVYAIEPLDREKKGLHLIVVNLTLAGERHRRQLQTVNPIAEFVKKKLAPNQALVLVRVLDENDNPPTFIRLNAQNQYVFTVDWQAPLLQPIARVQAVDPDEHPQIKYSLSSNDYFVMNETSGVILVQRSLLNVDEEVFELEVKATDGKHETVAPTKIYKLAPGLNIAILTVPLPETEVDELQFARKLTQLLEKEVRVLVKQVYIGEDGHADPKKTHLFVYALDRDTKRPVLGYTLKSLLDKVVPELKNDHEVPISSITLPVTSSTFRLTVTEIILLGVSACLLCMACCMLFVLLRCCRRKTILAKPDTSYMVESREANPRPYNVELISRKTAQQVLSERSLPDSHEEITMSPESRASMIASAGIHLPHKGPRQSSSQRTLSSTVTDEIPPMTGFQHDDNNTDKNN